MDFQRSVLPHSKWTSSGEIGYRGAAGPISGAAG
jgi:hypothetical protein